MTAATGAGARAAAVEFLQREHADAGPLVVLACIPARVFVKEETFLVHAVVAAPQQNSSSALLAHHRAFVAVVTAERAVAFSAAFCGIGDAPQNGGLSNFAKLPNATPAECSLQFETDAVGREFHGAVRLALIGVPQLQPAAEAAATKPMKLHAHGKRQSLLALFGRRRRGSDSDSSSSDSRGTHSDGEERTEVSISFPHSVRHVAHCGRESAAAAEDVAATTAPIEQPHHHHHHHHKHHHYHHKHQQHHHS